MKCSGKKYPYQAATERLEKEKKEQKLKDVINQANRNENNLKYLAEKTQRDSGNITTSLQRSIDYVAQVFHEDSKNWQQKLKSLTNVIKKIEQQQLDLSSNFSISLNDNNRYMENFRENFTEILSKIEKSTFKNITEVSKQLAHNDLGKP